MFGSLAFDLRDQPSADEIEEVRARVFSAPLLGLSLQQERALVVLWLAERNRSRRMGIPVRMIQAALDGAVTKTVEPRLAGDLEAIQSNWLLARAHQVLSGLPTEEAVDRVYQATVMGVPQLDGQPEWMTRHDIVFKFDYMAQCKDRGDSKSEVESAFRGMTAYTNPPEQVSAQTNRMISAIVTELYGKHEV